MRDLTDAEKVWIKKGLCPGCHRDSLVAGPQGGLSINWLCTTPECQARYNLAIVTPPDGTAGRPFFLLAEVIDESKLEPQVSGGTLVPYDPRDGRGPVTWFIVRLLRRLHIAAPDPFA